MYECPLLLCLFPSHSCLPPPHPELPSCSAFVGGFGAPSRSRLTGKGKRYSLFCKEVQSQTLTESWSTAQRYLPKLRILHHVQLQAQLRYTITQRSVFIEGTKCKECIERCLDKILLSAPFSTHEDVSLKKKLSHYLNSFLTLCGALRYSISCPFC